MVKRAALISGLYALAAACTLATFCAVIALIASVVLDAWGRNAALVAVVICLALTGIAGMVTVRYLKRSTPNAMTESAAPDRRDDDPSQNPPASEGQQLIGLLLDQVPAVAWVGVVSVAASAFVALKPRRLMRIATRLAVGALNRAAAKDTSCDPDD